MSIIIEAIARDRALKDLNKCGIDPTTDLGEEAYYRLEQEHRNDLMGADMFAAPEIGRVCQIPERDMRRICSRLSTDGLALKDRCWRITTQGLDEFLKRESSRLNYLSTNKT